MEMFIEEDMTDYFTALQIVNSFFHIKNSDISSYCFDNSLPSADTGSLFLERTVTVADFERSVPVLHTFTST